MKLKRFLAFVVSLAMVLSIVPAFSLTASAAEAPEPDSFTDELLEKMITKAPTVVDYSGDSGYNDADLNANWGWTPYMQYKLRANLRTYDGHDTLQLYNNENNGNWNVGRNIKTSVEVQSATSNKDYIVIEFLTHYSESGYTNHDETNTITLYSADPTGSDNFGAPSGTEILKFNYGERGIEPCTVATQDKDTYVETNITGGRSNFVGVRAYIAKNSAGTYDVIWRVKNAETGAYETKLTTTGLPPSRMTNGFHTLRCYFRYDRDLHIGFSDLKIYAGNYNELDAAEITASYTVDGKEVYAVTKRYVDTSKPGVDFEEYYHAPNGSNTMYYATAQTLSESAAIEMTKLDNWSGYAAGDEISYNGKNYRVATGGNLIPNGDFSEDTAGWYNGAGGSASFFASSGDGKMTTTAGDTGQGGVNSLYRAWAVEKGKTYAFTYYSSGGGEWHKTSVRDDVPTAATENNGTVVMTGTAGSDNLYVFTAERNYIQVSFRWLNKNGGEVFGNFGLYEVARIPASAKIRYMNNGVEIATSNTVEGLYEGDSYTVTDIPNIIEFEGTTYVPDVESSTLTATLTEGENVFVVNYKAGTIADTEISATTRVGVIPTLPTQVEAKLEGLDATALVSVNWSEMTAEQFNVAADTVVPITGSVSGSDAVITANVTVVDKDTYLLAHYAFEDNAQTNGSVLADETVNEYVATVSGDDLSSVEGVFGNAINLDGSGYLTLSDDLTQAISDAVDAYTGFTMSTFVKKNDAKAQFLFSMHGTEEQAWERAYGIIDSEGNDALRFEGLNYYDNTATRKMYANSGTHANEDSEFIHLAVTFDYTSGDGLGLIKFYLNGVDVTDTSRGVKLTNGKIDFTPAMVKEGSQNSLFTFVGLSPYPGDGNYNGYLDEFKIYSVALTADEVADIGAKHTTTINYVYNGETVATEEVTGWNGQSVALLAQVKDVEGNYYIPTETAYTVDKEKTTANVDVTLDETKVDVTATYVLPDGKVVKTETKMSENGAGIVFDELWVANDGENYNYYTEGAILTADGEIKLEAKANKAHYAVGETITTTNGETYKVLSGNLVPNGDFSDDFTGWLNGGNGTELNFTLNKDAANITSKGNHGNTSTSSLYRSWAIEPGATYVFRGYHSNMNSYQVLSFSNELGENEAELIVGDGDKIGSIHGNFIPDETSSYAFTNTDNYKYVKIRYRWNVENTFGDFGLYKVEPVYTDYTLVVEGTASDNGSTTVQAFKAAEVEIPAFDGYVLKNRVVDEANKTVTLTYAANVELGGTWAQRNYIAGTKPFNEMKFLGSHNSFTDKMHGDKEYIDEAGVLYEESGAVAAANSPSTALPMSKNQEADALTQLNAGVRFFDIRLSRQSDGTYYTRHGLISEDFKTVATTIAQYAEENPGEVIVLDFQSMFDALYNNEEHGVITDDNNRFGGSAGDDNLYAYQGLWQLLEETGLAEYIAGNIPLDTSYNALTDNGTKTAVVAFAKGRGSNTITQFINRSNLGAVYMEPEVKNYPIIGDVTQPTNYSDIVNHINSNYASASGFVTIHAYTTPTVTSGSENANGDTSWNLITNANANNEAFYHEANFAAWMEKGNVLLLDNVVSDAEYYIELFKEYNRDGYTVTVGEDETFVKTGENFKYTAANGAVALVEAPATEGEKSTIYPVVNGVITVENIVSDRTFTPYGLGVDMVQGAQVRIGDGVDENGKITAGSGLRFITVMDTTDSLAKLIYTEHYDSDAEVKYTEGYEIGVKLTAEDGENAEYIPATLWQTEGEVFTTALTNLVETNYIRKFTATPYVKVNGVYIDGTGKVERSIYQVAAGLLKNGYVAPEGGWNDSTGTDYTKMSEKLIAVLNAYVNQTGIRLELSDPGADATVAARVDGAETEVNGAYGYGDDIFFNVELDDVTAGETYYSYTITITPGSENVVLKSWWKNYIRINNSKTQAQGWIETVSETEDSITFTFTPEIDANKVATGE